MPLVRSFLIACFRSNTTGTPEFANWAQAQQLENGDAVQASLISVRPILLLAGVADERARPVFLSALGASNPLIIIAGVQGMARLLDEADIETLHTAIDGITPSALQETAASYLYYYNDEAAGTIANSFIQDSGSRTAYQEMRQQEIDEIDEVRDCPN